MSSHNNSPLNPLPPVVAALALLIVGIEAVFQLGARAGFFGPEAVGWRLEAVQRYAFSSDIFDWMLSNGRWPAEHVIRLLSYAFIHVSFTQALFAGVMVLALGKMVGEVFSQVAVLAVFVVGAVIGALAYGVLVQTPIPLIGAFPGAYALIGAFTYLLWLRLGQLGERQTRAFSLIGFLMGIQLVFGLLFGSQPDWVADLGGFVSGFVLSIFVCPGGWRRMRDRMRHR
ncbi:Rhomboid family protein [Thalassovita gelatinovora]|uniref:Rhomboid family protein n=1 Tax=Thalassovita gelatinovora TaxID=53501 RepID=A0A0P1FY98_THAGE|nr:rhomboid family intramembrane serine protease [Thalassovita gelatinovora]QIZ80548.1 rhomboid family intramembrane serine protease [Thalassovita gelatinovora]CUH66036.1 Rhomboid family protein [Thalassovita gelatinovora]SEQ75836.1 Membrane associated serine protease, rhomboid family [Thalassovita gelatinovora]